MAEKSMRASPVLVSAVRGGVVVSSVRIVRVDIATPSWPRCAVRADTRTGGHDYGSWQRWFPPDLMSLRVADDNSSWHYTGGSSARCDHASSSSRRSQSCANATSLSSVRFTDSSASSSKIVIITRRKRGNSIGSSVRKFPSWSTTASID